MGTGRGGQSRARLRASDQHVHHSDIRDTEDVQVISSGRRGGQRAPQGTPSRGWALSDCGPPSPLSWLGELLGAHGRGVSAAGIPGVGPGGRCPRAEVSW